MARQDKDGFVDPALVAAWRRMLWLMRGSADVVEALVPVAAGMTKEEVSRLLARAGAPSGKGVEPVDQVLGLLGVIPRARYEALLSDYQTLLKEYEELGSRVGEAEQNIERLREMLREQGLADEEQLLDSWGGLVRRTLRAQAGLVRSLASAAGNVAPPAGPPTGATPDGEPVQAGALAEAAQAQVPEPEPVEARAPESEPASPPPAAPKPAPRRTASTGEATRKGTSSRGRTASASSGTSASKRAKKPESAVPDPAPPAAAGASGATKKRAAARSRTAEAASSTPPSKRAKRAG
jgi:hypothetical protein